MTPIRRATVADARTIAEISVDTWRRAYADILPAELLAGLSVDERAAGFARMLRGRAATWAAFVAGDGGAPAGFGCCGIQRSRDIAGAGFAGEFEAIYVRPVAQRKGVGRALMRAMATSLAGHDIGSASVWVLRDNTPARRFYERLGGALIGEREDVRPEHTYIEVAYGWKDLSAVRRSQQT